MKADKKASKNTFSVIFVIQKGKCRPDGKAPIVARITVNGEMVHFSTKMYIEPERWLPLEYKTKGQTHEEQVINSTLFDFHSTIKRKYNDMIYRGEVITASKIKSSILCQDERSMTLIALCNKYIEDYEKLVLTQDYGQESFFRYKVCRNRLQEFLRDEFKVSDLPLQDINKRFWTNYTFGYARHIGSTIKSCLKTVGMFWLTISTIMITGFTGLTALRIWK